MTKGTIGFLKGLRARYGGNFLHCIEIESFDRTKKREVAKRDLQLRFDKKTGYVGHKVNGTVLDGISLYDRVLIIRSDGSYTVSEAPDKLFAGRDMLYCGLVDTEQVFNLVYTDPFQYNVCQALCDRRLYIEPSLSTGSRTLPRGGVYRR